jgi:protein-L-isoaspartate(D-aspartate) O-methyltransferase
MSVAAYPATFDGRRTIPSAEVTQLMLQLLDLTPQDTLLEIGTGSGSQTKLFAQTGAIVHSVELEPFVDPTIVIGECVYLHQRDGGEGLPEWAPFTAIVATCGVEQIPDAWIAQLAIGGRLLVPVGDVRSQKLTLFRKTSEGLIPVRIGAYVRFQMLRRNTTR